MRRRQEYAISILPQRVFRTYSGGQLLGKWRGEEGEDTSFPEDWAASCVQAGNPGRESVIEGLSRIDDPIEGNPYLKDRIEADPEWYLGRTHAEKFGRNMGFLAKIIDASERLSIQVHPDREFAGRELGSAYGKTETWYILGGRVIDGEEPHIYMGFKESVTKELWREIFLRQDKDAMLACLHKIYVHPGDVFYIEAGLPHAIGPGCFLTEVQEPTDYTFRTERTTSKGMKIEDMLCHQGVGFEKMLNCFHYETYTERALLTRFKIIPHLIDKSGECRLERLLPKEIRCLFGLRRICVKGEYHIKRQQERFSILIVKSGSGCLDIAGEKTPLCQGGFLFIRAGSEIVTYTSEEGMEVLECLPPE